jgi:glycosyltransferase involved in cell wall biosynthesis
VVAVSLAVAASLETLGVPHSRIVVIHGSPLPAFDSQTDWHSNRIVAVSRLTPWKGVHTHVEVLKLLRAEFIDFEYVHYGDSLFADPTYAEGVQTAIRQSELEGRATLAGHIPNVRQAIADAAVLLHTPLEPDPLPTAILEAISVGTPVVAFDLGGIAEILGEAPHAGGITVAPGDIRGAARAVQSLLQDTELRDQLSRNGRLRFEQEFDYRRTGAKLELALTRVAHESAS